jgi:hypothetical protein
LNKSAAVTDFFAHDPGIADVIAVDGRVLASRCSDDVLPDRRRIYSPA